MAQWYKEAFDEFYPDVYSHRDEKEAREFAAFLGSIVPLKNLRVLDVCCGEGRHIRAFGEAGATCFGLDLSEVLLAKLMAKESRGVSVVVRGDMRSFPFKSESFDVCINMFTSLGYFEDRQEELEVLREVRRVLRPRGFFVLDHVNPNWIKANFEPYTVKKRAALLIEETRTMLLDGRLVEKRTVIRSVEAPSVTMRDYTERLALFSKVELEQMLGNIGYEIVSFYGNYDGARFEEETSPRLMILSRKRND
jgi:SAM-dependent methyltransferase